MISIITRCRNRLEYTCQCLNAVRLNTDYPDYEHIIIDNNSSDGTFEWFRWMQVNTAWHSQVKYYRMTQNWGDWGGMRIGFQHISPETKYIVQLDNDIIPDKRWLTAMIEVLQNVDCKIVMLKRENVYMFLQTSCPFFYEDYALGWVDRAVACYMIDKDLFAKMLNEIPDNLGYKSKPLMSDYIEKKVVKILNVRCTEIEGTWHREKKYKATNPEIWQKV